MQHFEELDKARQQRALQLQSTPEKLDAIFSATAEGPNMNAIETYWYNKQQLTTSRQTAALEQQTQLTPVARQPLLE